MTPTPIPDAEVFLGGERVVIAPPRGHEITGDIRAVEAMIWQTEGDGAYRYSFRVELEGDDLARLAAGEPVWLTFLGSVPPFYVDTAPPVGPPHHYHPDGDDI